MTDRSPTPDPFEEALAASLAHYAADAGGTGDAYAIADAMLEARRKRRFRIGLAAMSGVLATAVLAGIAIGALAEPQPQIGPGPTESAAPSSEPTTEALPGVEAPEACGFPDGTALSYAGRSTTSALDVQEVVGDPMSFEPADIYVTWDRVDWGGWGRVRLVCAIFVGPAGFVEITVHPEDGGRATDAPEPSTPAPACSPAPSAAAGIGDGPYEVTVAELWQAGQCGESLAKYGGTDLVLDAYPGGIGAIDPCPSLEPRWLNPCGTGLFLWTSEQPPGDDGLQPPGVLAVLHPDLGVVADMHEELYPRSGEPALVRVIAHYDDPAASECRHEEWPEGIGPSPSPSDVVDRCRRTLVVTAIEPIER